MCPFDTENEKANSQTIIFIHDYLSIACYIPALNSRVMSGSQDSCRVSPYREDGNWRLPPAPPNVYHFRALWNGRWHFLWHCTEFTPTPILFWLEDVATGQHYGGNGLYLISSVWLAGPERYQMVTLHSQLQDTMVDSRIISLLHLGQWCIKSCLHEHWSK